MHARSILLIRLSDFVAVEQYIHKRTVALLNFENLCVQTSDSYWPRTNIGCGFSWILCWFALVPGDEVVSYSR